MTANSTHQPRQRTNSLGMALVRVDPGTFQMGSRLGDHDERPAHDVTLTTAFWLAATPVTNAQFEQFDPSHRALRGRRGLSSGDDEAVLFVSWHEAVAFCSWLSQREGQPYRLPTEAEWEYACRAGTDSAYHTGNTLPDIYHRAQGFNWDPLPVDLTVGRTPANAWGLHDMHGLVEEWCWDWYGPYPDAPQTDPPGHAHGIFRVTRGGSHNTGLGQLRSANRLGTLPEDRHWLIGLRVVQAEAPSGDPLPHRVAKLWQQGVRQVRRGWPSARSKAAPFFQTPIPFVHPPIEGFGEAFYPHNHCPSITWCKNGDLLACWFSTISERGREMTILASRLRSGADTWEPSSEFFKAPDRNMTGSSLFNDDAGTLYHFNGLEAGGGWANLALVMRTSIDNGATWTTPRLINPDHGRRNQVIHGAIQPRDGILIQPCDAVHGGQGGTAIHLSQDGGATWIDPGVRTPAPDFVEGGSGGTIAGIHAGVVALRDGRLLALGRGDVLPGQTGPSGALHDRMPMSISADMGRTWTYHASAFPPISSGQRLALLRLRQGPILFASFTGPIDNDAGLPFRDEEGRTFRGHGLFAALSFDEGQTWPLRRLLTPGEGDFQTEGHTRHFHADAAHAEPRGYLAATQSPDRTIHLLSSGLHYRFNLAWLKRVGESMDLPW